MKTIKIDKATAERWLKSEVQELKDLALQTYPELGKNKLPKTWEELEKISGYYVEENSEIVKSSNYYAEDGNQNIFATKDQCEASVALAMLSQLREVYRDGWKPDWEDMSKNKYIIGLKRNGFEITDYKAMHYFLSFQSAEIRDLFLKNFRELIEKAKPLMS